VTPEEVAHNHSQTPPEPLQYGYEQNQSLRATDPLPGQGAQQGTRP